MLRNPIFLWFFRGGGPDPLPHPPLDPPMNAFDIQTYFEPNIYCRVQLVMQHWSPSFQQEQEKSTNRRKIMKTLKMGLLCPSSLPIVQKRCMKLYFFLPLSKYINIFFTNLECVTFFYFRSKYVIKWCTSVFTSIIPIHFQNTGNS